MSLNRRRIKLGVSVPEQDVGALTERLTRLIERADVHAGMGAPSRAFGECHNDIDPLNDRLAEIFQELGR